MSEIQVEQNRPSDSKAWAILERVVTESQREQKRARRWKIFFKVLTFLYIGVILYLFVGGGKEEGMKLMSEKSAAHVASVSIEGPIMSGGDAQAEHIIDGLQLAFEDKNTKAIMLKINSPGGSPVQAGYVYDAINRLRADHEDIKVYAVIEDIGASGAYYIAAAADEIWADKASLVGSIGVISPSFGFVGLMDKLGIERRTYHAGENKAMLDPFSPEDPEQAEFWKEVLNTTHAQFINQVKLGRGKRLADNPDIFSGLIWSGEQALGLGLIDGLGSVRTVAMDQVGVDNIIDFTVRPDPFQQFVGRLGASIGKGIAQTMGIQDSIQLR